MKKKEYSHPEVSVYHIETCRTLMAGSPPKIQLYDDDSDVDAGDVL